MAKLKKVLKIIALVLVLIFFIAALVAVIASIHQQKTGVPGAFGYSFATVESNSMSGTFEVGDIVIGKLVDADTVIEIGDIVTYKAVINNVITTKTHRVSDIDANGEIKKYQTWGDNRNRDVCPVPDDGYRTVGENGDIIAVYKGKIPGLGNFISFLRQPVGFILLVVLPLVLFIGYEIFSLIRIYMNHKKAEIVKEAKDNTSDDVKAAIIQEYLNAQKAAGKAQETEDADNSGTSDPS